MRSKSTGPRPSGLGNQLKQRLLANKYHILGYAGALDMSVGQCLARFVDETPLQLLQVRQQRFLVPLQSLPADLRSVAFGRTRRSYIREADCRTRLDVIWQRKQSSLFSHIDMGGVGWHGMETLYCDWRCRGWFFAEPAHRRHDNWLLSLQRAGVAMIKHEATLCVSIGSAPWGGCGHFCKYSEASVEFFKF